MKLFLTSGQIYHQASVKVKKGRNKLVFGGISAYANPQSIQFKSSASYRLISFSTEMDFLAAEQFNPRIADLKDSLQEIKVAIQVKQDVISSYHAETSVMKTNKGLKGANANLTVSQIKEAAEYYRKRTLEINMELSKLNREKRELAKKEDKIRYQLTELNVNENQRSNQVIVLIDVDQPGEIKCDLNYLVSDCGWAATYDLSAQDLNQQISLKYKAKVYNNTGNNWNNVNLVLLTADPNLSASSPVLTAWYLGLNGLRKMKKSGYINPQVIQQDYRSSAVSNLNVANQWAYDNYGEEVHNKSKGINSKLRRDLLEKARKSVRIEQIEISELTAEFDIPNKFSCPSDAKPYVVDIKDINIDAKFSYVTVPKIDNGAFLLANIVGWQELNLMPGPTNVYFGGQYVGVSNIDTRNVSDTLALSFGRDTKISVVRKLKSEMSTKKVVGNSMRESFTYEIAVRNNRSLPIKMVVYDQVPVSKNSDISISSESYSGGKKNEETGEVEWEITLQPGEVKTLELSFTVKHPKNISVRLQKNRVIMAPKF